MSNSASIIFKHRIALKLRVRGRKSPVRIAISTAYTSTPLYRVVNSLPASSIQHVHCPNTSMGDYLSITLVAGVRMSLLTYSTTAVHTTVILVHDPPHYTVTATNGR